MKNKHFIDSSVCHMVTEKEDDKGHMKIKPKKEMMWTTGYKCSRRNMEAVGQNRAEWRRDICGLFSNFGLFSDGEYNASATQVISVL